MRTPFGARATWRNGARSLTPECGTPSSRPAPTDACRSGRQSLISRCSLPAAAAERFRYHLTEAGGSIVPCESSQWALASPPTESHTESQSSVCMRVCLCSWWDQMQSRGPPLKERRARRGPEVALSRLPTLLSLSVYPPLHQRRHPLGGPLPSSRAPSGRARTDFGAQL